MHEMRPVYMKRDLHTRCVYIKDCNTLQHTATHCNTLQYTATHCNTLLLASIFSLTNTLQHTATHCNTLQHTATHCNTLQYTTTRCVAVNALAHQHAHTNTHHFFLSDLSSLPFSPSFLSCLSAVVHVLSSKIRQ